MSSSAGAIYNNPFDYRLINLEGFDGNTPQFTFTESNRGDDRYNISDRISRYRMRLGLRYTFN